MEVIETQFRAGNISFLDSKPEVAAGVDERAKTQPSPRPERPRHRRKESILTK